MNAAVYTCQHCDSQFLTSAALRSHKNRTTRCKQKEKALLSRTVTSRVEVAVPVLYGEADSMPAEEEDHGVGVTPSNSDQIDTTPTVDIPFALAAALKELVGGRGLSNADMDKVLEIIHLPGFHQDKIPFRTGKACKKWLKRKIEVLHGPIENVKTIDISPKENMVFKFFYFDPVKALFSLLDAHFNNYYFVRNASKIYNSSNARIYSSPENSDWWNNCQSALREDTSDENAIILGLMFYSDATQLSGKGNKSGHPIVMSLANIPLHRRKKVNSGYKLLGMMPIFPKELKDNKIKTAVFNQCLEKLMEPLKFYSESGLQYKGCKLYPLLFAYVHDYPEGCKVSATGQGSQVNFPCSTCKVPRDSLTNVRRPFPPRTIDCIRELVESSNEKELHDHHSAFALKCAFWGFRYESTNFGNPYSTLMVDTLHQTDQGVFVHMMDILRKTLHVKKLNIIVNRQIHMTQNYWIGTLQLPNASRFWLDGISIQGNEHRAMMQVVPFLIQGIADDDMTKAYVLLLQWYMLAVRKKEHTESTLEKMEAAGSRFLEHIQKYMPQTSGWSFPKIHAIHHYSQDIRRGGATEEYSADMWENLHKTLMKGPYRGSNYKKVENQLMNHHAEVWSLSALREKLEEDEEADEDESLITENVVAKTGKKLNVEKNLAGHHSEKWRRFGAAIKEYMLTNFPNSQVPDKMLYFTFCEVGRTTEGQARDWTAYANPNHHGVAKYNFVSVPGEEDDGTTALWYCRIISFLEFSVQESMEREKHQVAYVEYLKKAPSQREDNLLKCQKYIWESLPRRYKIINLSNIVKIVHVVPRFKPMDDGGHPSGEFYLNEFHFKQ